MAHASTSLRGLLVGGRTVVTPDAYDPLSARIIERAGFPAVQCSGYSFAVAGGYACEADVGLRENVALTRRIVDAVNAPVMADGEDGFGGPEDVRETVREFVCAGAAGINIEDQRPRSNGEVRTIETGEMVEKIIAAREAAAAAGDPELVLNARTDALRAERDGATGLRVAIERANRYLAAGADLAFVCYVATLAEAATAVREIDGPVSIAAGQPYNMREFSVRDLCELGVARVSLPTLAICAAAGAMRRTLDSLNASDAFADILADGVLCTGDELTELTRT